MSSDFEVKGNVNRPIEERIKKCRQADGKSITDLAELFGVSRPVLSKVLSGVQPGRDELLKKMEEYAESVEEQHPDLYKEDKHLIFDKAFIQTKDANNVIGVCAAARDTSGLGVIVGKSGFGKTHALRYFAHMPRVAYVECDAVMTARDLLTCIEEELGITKNVSPNIWPRLRNLQRFFSVNLGWLLIIDEADKLITSNSDKKLEVMRSLFDQSTLGVVIAGEPKLKSTIENYSDRFANRVDYFYKMEGIKEEEIRNELNDMDIDDKAMELIVARATNKKNGCFRLFDRTMDNVERLMRLKGETRITVELINEASSLMML
ncbi:MAG: AAA family ATPase [Anaerovoracaceae bacterium]